MADTEIRMHDGRTMMTKGGSLTTLSFYGGEKVVDHYNMMGPV